MIHSTFHKYFLSLGVVCFILNVAYSQGQLTTSNKTLVFKVKEKYRNLCSNKLINHNRFSKSTAGLKEKKLFKAFPKKEKKDLKNKIDLSLIYQMNYEALDSENEVIRKLLKTGLFEYVESYVLPKLAFTPNDTRFVEQYHLDLINAINAWDINKGDTNVVIGITDTGWDPTHPDLIANVKVNFSDPINGIDDDGDGFIDNNLGWDLGMNDNNALFESTSHGVHVTGIAAAATNNGEGIAGVGFNTKFLPIKISNATGILTHAYQGIVYAADHGCDIINCSWGSYSDSQFQRDVINYALEKGCIIVAAVGNDNKEDLFYPAAYDGVVAVASTNQNDLKQNVSNFGYYIDISAPGESLLSTTGNGNYGFNGGTSISAPIISAAAALVKAQFSTYTNEQIVALIKATADDLSLLNPVYDDKLGKGRIDLFNALSNNSAQFVEMNNHFLTDNNNNTFTLGDTIRLVGTFTNFLEQVNNLVVRVSSDSPYLNFIDDITNFPLLNTLDTGVNELDPFLIEVLDAPVNEEAVLKIEITNGGFIHNQYISVSLNPNYVNLNINQLSTTITSNGAIGFIDENNSVGLGFVYKGQQLLSEAGLIIGDSQLRVADAIRGTNGKDQDFLSIDNVAFTPPFKSSLDLKGVMDDSQLMSPMNINIVHSTYAHKSEPNDKYIIINYEIENVGFDNLKNLRVGVFADWDVLDGTLNRAGYDIDRTMGYIHSIDEDTVYVALKLLSSNLGTHYAFDLNGSGGIDLVNGGFSTSEKYMSLSISNNSAGGQVGSDVAHVVSTNKFNLNPDEKKEVSFAIIAGDNLSDIQTSADAAQNSYLNGGIVGIEEVVINNQVIITPNPSKGIVKVSVATDKNVNSIVLRNALGNVVKRFYTSYFDITSYENGIYFLEVETNKGIFINKLVLAK